MIPKPSPLDRTAYHEAGHVVVAARFGRTIDYSEVKADHGNTHTFDPPPDEWEKDADDWYREECIIQLAGMESEWIVFGGYSPEQVEIEQRYSGIPMSEWPVTAPYDGDYNNLAELLLRIAHPHASGTLVDELRKECRCMIQLHQSAIEAVARALLAQGRLTGQEIAALL